MSPRAHDPTQGPLAGVLLVGALLMSSCGLEFKGQATELRLSRTTLEILGGSGPASEELEAQLERLFGTRQSPGFAATWEGAGRRGAPDLAAAARLYADKCLHCHGNEGGGDGVTAHSLRPVPRDFRRGIFKFHSLKEGARPEPVDLARVIREGIEGTAMPSYQTLPETEIQGLAEYTRLLGMRGEVELLLASDYEIGEGFSQEAADEVFELVHERWIEAARERLVVPAAPPATAAKIERGFELFHDAEGANCAACHGSAGRSPGPLVFGPSLEDPEELGPLLFDAWGLPAIPRDLQRERYLFGDEPQQLFERIFLGIDGTPMFGIGETRAEGGERMFPDEDLWALVHYVRSLRRTEGTELREELDYRPRGSAR